MFRNLAIITILISLAGCNLQEPAPPIEQKLAGKTASERHEILLDACKNKARNLITKRYVNRHIVENTLSSGELIDICNAMYNEMNNAK